MKTSRGLKQLIGNFRDVDGLKRSVQKVDWYMIPIAGIDASLSLWAIIWCALGYLSWKRIIRKIKDEKEC